MRKEIDSKLFYFKILIKNKMSMTMSRMWQAKSSNEPKYNPLSPASDNYCEKIYKTLQDGHGVFQERVLKLC
jgi:hypothetical protein